jgi:hypothetical protein
VREFLAKHASAVIATLSGFDRLLFRGTLLQLAHHAGVLVYLGMQRMLLKDFAEHAQRLTSHLKACSEELADSTGRPYRYLYASDGSKEQIAREIAETDGIEQGLICIFGAVEPCLSYDIVRDRAAKRLRLMARQRKCLHLYHYHMHPVFGFMHARIQTWFPFSIQVCLNGREWLARAMDAAGLGYLQHDNGFTWLQDPARAQQLLDQQTRAHWPDLLNAIAHGLNPRHAAMFLPCRFPYYWTTVQSEWASDLLFRDRQSLARLYPRLVQHGLTTFRSPDVRRFLGRKTSVRGSIPPRLQAEVTTDMKRRAEGVRIKHRVGDNSVKMYDKQGRILRVETTINDVKGFKVFRAPQSKPDAAPAWRQMRKGVADLHRRSETSQAANDRYLRTLASVDDATPLGRVAGGLCRPVQHQGRRVRALNPYAAGDARLIAAISRGEVRHQWLPQPRPAGNLVRRRQGTARGAAAACGGGLAATGAAARAPADHEGGGHPPLSPDPQRAHRGDGIGRIPKHWDRGFDEARRLAEIFAPLGDSAD